jgi:hypothetical protein
VRDRLPHQVEAERQRRSLVDGLQQPRVVGGIHHHHHTAEILGSRAHQGRPADIDLLDQRVKRRRRVRRRLHKWIEIDDDDVDQADAVRGNCGQIVGPIASGQDAAMQGRVKRLHPAVEHLGKAGHLGDIGDRQARIGQRPRRAAGGNQFETARDEALAQIGQAGFVRHTQQGSWHIGESSVLSLRRRAGLAP